MPPDYETAIARVRAALKGRAAVPLGSDVFRPAAILVPILRRQEGPAILLTRRTRSVPHHKGQIAFPGGRLDPGEDARACALREAEEEVGLERSRVEVLGALDESPSVSGYAVAPFAGAVADPPATFRARPEEVDEIFEVPLALLFDVSRWSFEWRDPSSLPPGTPVDALMRLTDRFEDFDAEGRRFKVHTFHAGPTHPVWGLTSRVLRQLLARAFGFTP